MFLLILYRVDSTGVQSQDLMDVFFIQFHNVLVFIFNVVFLLLFSFCRDQEKLTADVFPLQVRPGKKLDERNKSGPEW